MPEIPQKKQYRFREVCEYTDTQPYVLRFWESEFPQLSPEQSRGGQPIYTRDDIDTVLQIKRLLQEEEQSIDSARDALNGGNGHSAKSAARKAVAKTAAAPATPARRAPKRQSRPEPVREPDLFEEEPVEASRPPLIEQADAADTDQPFDGVSRERYENAVDEIAHLRRELTEHESRLRKAEQALEAAEESCARLRERNARALAIVEKVARRLS